MYLCVYVCVREREVYLNKYILVQIPRYIKKKDTATVLNNFQNRLTYRFNND